MLRAAIKAAVILALGYGFARGVLALFTDLDWAALTVTEQLVIVAVLAVPLGVIAASVLWRGWRMRERAAYFADLGFTPDSHGVHRTRGGWFGVHATELAQPDGSRRDVWLINARALHPGKALVIQPGEAGAWTKDGNAELLDEAALARLAAIPDLVQLRVTSVVVQIMLARPTSPPNVRRAIAFVAEVAGIRLPTPAAEPAPPPAGALERGVPTYRAAGVAAIVYFLAVIVVGFLAPDSEGYEDFILARTRACRIARDALGEPITRTQLGWQPSSQSNRNQTSRMIVRGPRGEGTITIRAWVRSRGTDPRAYPIVDAVLDGPGAPIEVYACSRSWTAGITAPREWRARVRGAQRATCAVRVEPSPGSGHQECRLEVTCGGRPLYGATPEVGHADCWTVRDRGRDDVVVSDPDRGLPRPEPTAELDERTGLVQIGRVHVLELER